MSMTEDERAAEVPVYTAEPPVDGHGHVLPQHLHPRECCCDACWVTRER